MYLLTPHGDWVLDNFYFNYSFAIFLPKYQPDARFKLGPKLGMFKKKSIPKLKFPFCELSLTELIEYGPQCQLRAALNDIHKARAILFPKAHKDNDNVI